MGFGYCADTSAAAWIVGSPWPWQQVVGFGPGGFASYARLRFIPDPVAPGQTENDVVRPDDRLSDIEQAARAVRLLTPFTTTPKRCFAAVWEGYPDVDIPLGTPLVDLVHRRYAVLGGSPADLVNWTDIPPAFLWPADRSWCFASDVDPHWAGISGSSAAIEVLLRDPVLDVVSARPGEPQPVYR